MWHYAIFYAEIYAKKVDTNKIAKKSLQYLSIFGINKLIILLIIHPYEIIFLSLQNSLNYQINYKLLKYISVYFCCYLNIYFWCISFSA